jgi:hypothetical protein
MARGIDVKRGRDIALGLAMTLAVIGLPAPSRASESAAPVSLPDLDNPAVVKEHCAPLVASLARMWGDVAAWAAVYVWKSPSGYLFGWQHGQRADRSEHYCTRLMLRSTGASTLQGVTLLCSIDNRGLPTETATFGNIETAARLCPASDAAKAEMDAHPVLFWQTLPPTKTASGASIKAKPH